MKLENYGFIGDMHTGALVGESGSIDWLCFPRFDSPACFAALLGTEQNGLWTLAPQESSPTVRHSYRGDSMILQREFQTSQGVVRVIDFMPTGQPDRMIIRIVEGVSGRVPMRMNLRVRFDYGRTVPWVHSSAAGITATAGPNALMLRCTVATHGEDLATVAHFTLEPGQSSHFVLTWYPSHKPEPPVVDPYAELAKTADFWEKWVAKCNYTGEFRSQVIRSLLTLKALTYAPTGGIVAAATTSLPEQLGGSRNWDYRFCWLRDATFTLYSFLQGGFTEEATAWSKWLTRAVAGDPSQLQIMYGPAGERQLVEYTLPHLPGYEGSSPVRIGNAAAEQFQLDVYGEVMDSFHLARQHDVFPDLSTWPLQRHLTEFVEANWFKPDEGIWEVRGPRRHFTHSKIMAWVAVDRAVKAIETFGVEGPVDRWRALRDKIHQDVCENGFHAQRQAFTQYYGSGELDASLLMAPLVGFLPATDPRIISTVELIQKELMVDGFVLRYHTKADQVVDGLPPGEGAFLACSFWLVDCLHLMGREAEARELFHRLLKTASPLGLLAEEYDPGIQRMVGNMPQAFSHVGLVNSARNLSSSVGAADERSANVPGGGGVSSHPSQEKAAG